MPRVALMVASPAYLQAHGEPRTALVARVTDALAAWLGRHG